VACEPGGERGVGPAVGVAHLQIDGVDAGEFARHHLHHDGDLPVFRAGDVHRDPWGEIALGFQQPLHLRRGFGGKLGDLPLRQIGKVAPTQQIEIFR